MAWCSCRHNTTTAAALLLLLQLIILIYIAAAAAAAAASDEKKKKPAGDCPSECGNVHIPFPFGIGDACHLTGKDWFNLTCNHSSNPPKPYWGDDKLEIMNISSQEGQVTFNSPVGHACSNSRSSILGVQLQEDWPFTVSSARTVLTAIGCNTLALIEPFGDSRDDLTGCLSICSDVRRVANNSCTGIGCCQSSLPSGIKNLSVFLFDNILENSSTAEQLNPCSYAFLVDKDQFEFSVSDLFPGSRYKGNNTPVPAVVDWAIANQTCESAQADLKTFACNIDNSICHDFNNLGYRCNCREGYRGNPYIKGAQGCQDINECNENPHICGEKKCKNTKGSYSCKSHPWEQKEVKALLGIGICLLFIFVCSWIYWGLEKRKLIKLRKKFFQKNGGLLLQQQIASYGVNVATKIFSAEELERATNKYDDTRIIGRGGYGTVYRGVLPDHGTVAIKKSKIVDESRIEQFINEVFILSQINHRNVVKLLGCCLETQVPILVYEFIRNGTLFKHIHDLAHPSSLSWENRLRIAWETAEALAYLHFAASIPIFHRDVKSTNILLENDLTAKVSDFGASRLIPFDQTQVSTIVQGTSGYLDPEYIQTGQLTEKSDVYSFGVVLVELLTGETPTSLTRNPEERNLSMYFLLSMKEKGLFNILDRRLVDEGGVEQLMAVAQLAKRCLSVKGEERPTMKEVAIELEELRMSAKHSCVKGKHEDTQSELGEPSEAYRGNDNAVEQGSSGNHNISPLEIGR